MFDSLISKSKKGYCIKVRIVPRAAKNQLIECKEEYLKLAIKSPPVDNKANKEIIIFLAKTFKVAKSQISLISGLKSKNKLIEIAGVDKKRIESSLKI